MGEVVEFPKVWRYGADPFVLIDSAGTRIHMRQGADVWWPEWRRGGDVVKVTVWKAGPVPHARFKSEQDHHDWNKELGPICSVFPPPEWQVLMPAHLAREVARDIKSALQFFSRTFDPVDNWPKRIVPIEKVIFEGQMARFNTAHA